MDPLFQLRELDWDTRFFGVKMGEIYRTNAAAPERESDLAAAWSRTLTLARSELYRFLLYQFDSREQQLCGMVANESSSVLGDILVTLKLNLEKLGGSSETARSEAIVPATPEDLPEMMAMASTGFIYSRFLQDPRFDPMKAQQFYPAWLLESFNKNESMVVIKKDDKPAGFLLFQETPAEGLMILKLIAVDDKYRGQGLGYTLVNWLIRESKQRDCRTISVGTQINNYGAIRMYQKAGFRLENAKFRWHIWLGEGDKTVASSK